MHQPNQACQWVRELGHDQAAPGHAWRYHALAGTLALLRGEWPRSRAIFHRASQAFPRIAAAIPTIQQLLHLLQRLSGQPTHQNRHVPADGAALFITLDELIRPQRSPHRLLAAANELAQQSDRADSPFAAITSRLGLGFAHLMLNQADQAIAQLEWAKQALKQRPIGSAAYLFCSTHLLEAQLQLTNRDKLTDTSLNLSLIDVQRAADSNLGHFYRPAAALIEARALVKEAGHNWRDLAVVALDRGLQAALHIRRQAPQQTQAIAHELQIQALLGELQAIPPDSTL